MSEKEGRCVPPPAHIAHEFHWLIWHPGKRWHEAALWRWCGDTWRNACEPDQSHTPEVMHAAGWHYAEPCIAPVYRLVRK